MQLYEKPPWSKGQLRRFGDAIREGREHDATEPSYADFASWYAELQVTTQDRISHIDFPVVLGAREPRITGRPKTIDTLRQKLVRLRSFPLSSIVDIAGVRVEAAMTPTEQDALAYMIAEAFEQDYSSIAHDSRDCPHSGYRALHLRMNFPAGLVEVQVRTALQGAWANVYEELADTFGRDLRYGIIPDVEPVKRMVLAACEISNSIHSLEQLQVRLQAARSRTAIALRQKEKTLYELVDIADTTGMRARRQLELIECRNEIQNIEAERERDQLTHQENTDRMVASLEEMRQRIAKIRHAIGDRE